MHFRILLFIVLSLLSVSCDNKKESVSCFSKAEKISAENKNETDAVLAADQSSNPADLVASSNQASGQTKEKCHQLMDESMTKEKICPIVGPGHKYWYIKKVGDESSKTQLSCE